MSGFLLPDNYGIPMLSAILLGVECFLIGFLAVGRIRPQVFTKEFLKTNFAEIHYEHTEKEDVTTQFGYPDMGSGRYSEKLPYGDWLRFNRAQRVHQNFLELLTLAVVLILVAGIDFPQISGALGFLLCILRLVYLTYLSPGGHSNKLRLLATIMGNTTLGVLLILAIITCGYHMR